jgi:hypothetical protein
MKHKTFKFIIFILTISLYVSCSQQSTHDPQNDPRILFGREKLNSALTEAGIPAKNVTINLKLEKMIDKAERYAINITDSIFNSTGGVSESIKNLGNVFDKAESYAIDITDNSINITGTDPAGIFYGCLDVSEAIKKIGKLPAEYSSSETPVMNLRGVCILLMKLGTYNYPVTPEEFPFFYDKEMWLEYLDFLAKNKYNYIAFWNGHPFSYFTKLDKYPEAQDGMPEGLVEQNNKMLHWLVDEAYKRNIKLIFEFYNIHTSVYFQKAHQLPNEISEPTPLLAEYTSYCIEKFVNEFPQVGLYITAGEALDPEYSVDWVNHVILDAVKRTEKQPQILLRSWYLDINNAKEILDYYPNIYIERKYNVEMIADTLIDPQNKAWADLTGNYIVNIHMAANLEPFRWNPPTYIQKCMQSAVSVGANGLHLYPRKSWRWPYGAEIGDKRTQWQRDKLWFEMWGRYAWNPQRNKQEESKYWLQYFADEYGSQAAAESALSAFETGADVLPAIQRLFWAGHDNHTVVTSGLLLSQIERVKGIPFLPIDPVIRVPDYLELIKTGKDIKGVDPVLFLEKKLSEAKNACKKLAQAIQLARRNKEELNAHLDDARAVELTIAFYTEKLKAAVYKAKMNDDPGQSDIGKKFIHHLHQSLDYYHQLTDLTKGRYESISDVSAVQPLSLKPLPFHWSDILPYFEQEYQVYAEEMNQKMDPNALKPLNEGLAGVCYGSPGLVDPRTVLNTNTLEFDWGVNPPDDGRNWSVLFSGFIKPPANGEITFHIYSDQSTHIFIDNKKLSLTSRNLNELVASIDIIKNKWYPIRIEYDNVDTRGSNLVIKWSWDNLDPTDIDSSSLKHSGYNQKKAKRTILLGF